jgi:hypothetical protein
MHPDRGPAFGAGVLAGLTDTEWIREPFRRRRAEKRNLHAVSTNHSRRITPLSIVIVDHRGSIAVKQRLRFRERIVARHMAR